MTHTKSCICALMILILACSSSSSAKSPYFQHFDRGRKLYLEARDRSGEKALALYEAANRELELALQQEVKPGAQYFKALCLIELRRYNDAKVLLQLVAKYKSTPRKVKEEIPRLLDRIETELAQSPQLLILKSEPSGATIRLNDEPAGTTPLKVYKKPGQYNISIQYAGYQPIEEQIELRKEPIARIFRLQLQDQKEAPKQATLSIVTRNLQGASVHIDKKRRGLTPFTTDLSPGTHQIMIEKEGYHPITLSIKLDEGAIIDKQFILEPLEAEAGDYSLGSYITLGIGGASLITGGILHAFALQDSDKANEAGHTWKESQVFYDDASTKMNVAYVMYGVGGAALVTSLVLYLIQPDEKSAPRSYQSKGL